MPIDRELLHSRFEATEAFLDSQEGALLHEPGHYVAANIGGMISGHLIVNATAQHAAAAFVPDDRSAQRLAADFEWSSLVSSGGLLVEYFFCGQARTRRPPSDIEAYQSMFLRDGCDGDREATRGQMSRRERVNEYGTE